MGRRETALSEEERWRLRALFEETALLVGDKTPGRNVGRDVVRAPGSGDRPTGRGSEGSRGDADAPDPGSGVVAGEEGRRSGRRSRPRPGGGRVDANVETAVLSRAVASAAQRDPDRLVFIFENGQFPDEGVTAGELAVRGNQVAHQLTRAGIGKGDRVAIMIRNHPEFVYGMVANAKLALPTVPIDPRARGEKLHYFLTFAECAGLITADYVMVDEAAADMVKKAGVKVFVVSTAEGRAQGIDVSAEWPVLNEALEGPEQEEVGEHVDDIASAWLLSYTSGTTGDPKAIGFTHDRMLFYRFVPQFFGYQEDDVPYTGLSLTHGNALVVTMMPAIWGVVDHSVFSRWFTKTRLWDVCIKYGCTTWSNLGGIATAVYSEPPSKKDRAHQVRLVVSAGMPRELWKPFEERFGVKILEWYGTMEGGLAYNPPGVGPVGSFGKPPDPLEMEVVDENDQPVPPRQIGELVVRPKGGTAKLEYFKNPKASVKKTRGGWLHTGDMCWRDEEGWFYFGHRQEEGGLRKMGEFISEGFIRRVLAEDPEVLDVHVYGVPSRGGAPGETDIVTAVVVRDKEKLDVRRLFEHCVRNLERSHVPDVIQIVDDLPRTASEKVQARFLKEDLDAQGPNVFSRQAVGV
jgi:crotonobetaine/carnitine-CoA ligase